MNREILLTIERINQHRKITVYQPQQTIYKHVLQRLFNVF